MRHRIRKFHSRVFVRSVDITTDNLKLDPLQRGSAQRKHGYSINLKAIFNNYESIENIK